MARIFSIQFYYGGEAYNAMVSVRTTPFFTEYSINMLDENIADLLPNNKIVSTAKDHFVFSDSARQNEPALMKEIIKAVAGHMQTISA